MLAQLEKSRLALSQVNWDSFEPRDQRRRGFVAVRIVEFVIAERHEHPCVELLRIPVEVVHGIDHLLALEYAAFERGRQEVAGVQQQDFAGLLFEGLSQRTQTMQAADLFLADAVDAVDVVDGEDRRDALAAPGCFRLASAVPGAHPDQSTDHDDRQRDDSNDCEVRF